MKQHSQNKEASSKKHSTRKNTKSIEFWIVLVFYMIQIIIAILTYYKDKRGCRKTIKSQQRVGKKAYRRACRQKLYKACGEYHFARANVHSQRGKLHSGLAQRPPIGTICL
jgi:hypothetical protein